MRAKQLWSWVPLPTKLKLAWARVTFSRITTFYFIFSICHCFVQVIFQGQAFFINEQAATLLYKVIQQGNATLPKDTFPVLGSDLRVCDHVPSDLSDQSCRVLWQPKDLNSAQSSSGNQAQAQDNTSSAAASSTASVTPTSSVTTSSQPQKTVIVVTTTKSAPSSPTSISNDAKKVDDEEHDDDEGEDDDDEDDDHESVKNTVANAVIAPLTAARPTNGSVLFHLHRRITPRITSIGDEKIYASQVDGSTVVNVTGVTDNGEPLQLDHTCLVALNWPVGVLHNTKREDVTFIAFQFWVLGMSIVALLNESIPHILATLLTHMVATGWGGFQIWHTENFRQSFSRLTTKGACAGHNLLPTYWKDRGNAEIPSLALNIAALLVSAFLSWRLIKLFGWQTFKRVGASRTINRVYKLVLSLSINLQLALFFILATLGLWIDQLCNGAIGHLATQRTVYIAMVIVTMVLLVPWLYIGWFSVRREARKTMLIFLTLSLLYMAGWGGMFASTTFRWTFVTWMFFGFIASASVAFTLLAFILGVICRYNFGKGLMRHLNAEEPLPDNFVQAFPAPVHSDAEKVAFPSSENPIPTFSSAFGKGDEVPVPSKMFPPRQQQQMASRQMLGPRFYNQHADPFESEEDSLQRSTYSNSLLSDSGFGHSHSGSTGGSSDGGLPTYYHQGSLQRSDSSGSKRSVGSTSSGGSFNRDKRWVIE